MSTQFCPCMAHVDSKGNFHKRLPKAVFLSFRPSTESESMHARHVWQSRQGMQCMQRSRRENPAPSHFLNFTTFHTKYNFSKIWPTICTDCFQFTTRLNYLQIGCELIPKMFKPGARVKVYAPNYLMSKKFLFV